MDHAARIAKARRRQESVKAKLHDVTIEVYDAIRDAAADGVRQTIIVDASGYNREHIRRITRSEHGTMPPRDGYSRGGGGTIGHGNDFDRLVPDVKTASSTAAHVAIVSADQELAEADLIAAFQTPIEDLDLAARSYNSLNREGIHTIGELANRSEADLLDMRNFGARSIDEVKVKLVGLGLVLSDTSGTDDTDEGVATG